MQPPSISMVSALLPLLTMSAIKTIYAAPLSTSSLTLVRSTDSYVSEKLPLVRRLGNNSGRGMSDATDVWLDCTGWEYICEADAAAMLCLSVPDVMYASSQYSFNSR